MPAGSPLRGNLSASIQTLPKDPGVSSLGEPTGSPVNPPICQVGKQALRGERLTHLRSSSKRVASGLLSPHLGRSRPGLAPVPALCLTLPGTFWPLSGQPSSSGPRPWDWPQRTLQVHVDPSRGVLQGNLEGEGPGVEGVRAQSAGPATPCQEDPTRPSRQQVQSVHLGHQGQSLWPSVWG